MNKNVLFVLGSPKGSDRGIIESRIEDLYSFLDSGGITKDDGTPLNSNDFDYAYLAKEDCHTASGVISPTKWAKHRLSPPEINELFQPYKAVVTLDATAAKLITSERFTEALKSKYSYASKAVFPAQVCSMEDERFISLVHRIDLAYAFTEAGEIPQPKLTECVIVDTYTGLNEMYATVVKTGLCVFDVETNEINNGKKEGRVSYFQEGFKVTTLSISPCAGISYVMSIEHKDKHWHPNIFWAVINTLKNIFRNEAIIKVAQNLKYDLNALSVYGIAEYKGRFADTMLMAHLINEAESVGLERLTEMYLPTFHGYKIKNFNIGFDELAKYNAQDTDNTCRLFNFLEIKLREDMRKYKLYRSVIMPTFWELYYAERHGALIDTDYIEQSIIDCEGLIEEKHQELLAFQEVKDFIEKQVKEINFGSPKQLSELLYGAEGFKIKAFDQDTGLPTMSTAAEILATIDHPFIEILQQYRGLNKTLGTFFIGIRDKVHEGVIHAQFKLHGTRTGRASASEPNLQQLTSRTAIKDERVSEMILRTKKFFIAPKGYKIVQADFSQLELRLIALFSQDPNMLQAYKEGKDLHCLTASQINNMTYDEFMLKEDTDPKWYKTQRACGKGANFSLSYGCSADTYRVYLKTKYGTVITKKEAELHHKEYFKRFPSMIQWHDEYKAKGREYGYVRTFFGRTRLLPDILSTIPKLRASAERYGINCVSTDTEILTIDGWVTVDKLVEGQGVFSVNPSTKELEIDSCQAIHRHHVTDEPMVQIENDAISVISTLNHRWLVDRKKRGGVTTKFETSEQLSTHGDSRIWLSANCSNFNGDGVWNDKEVELIGWVLTDGHYIKPKNKQGEVIHSNCIRVTQSKPNYVVEIDALMNYFNSKSKHHVGWSNCYVWGIARELGHKIRTALPNRELTMPFLLSLSSSQLTLLYNTMLKGDGSNDKHAGRFRVMTTFSKNRTDMFTALCVMVGKSCGYHTRDYSTYTKQKEYASMMNKPKLGICDMVTLKQRNRAYANIGKTNINYTGEVWCPTTKNGTWVARRNGRVYCTGNSPVQGSGGELTFFTLSIAKQVLPPAIYDFFLTVHDSMAYYVDEDKVELFTWCVQKIASEIDKFFDYVECNRDKWNIQLTLDAEVGDNYGQLSKF